MSRTRATCSPTFRGQLVAFHHTGSTIDEIGRALGPSEQPLRNSVTDGLPAGGTAPTGGDTALSGAEREALLGVAWLPLVKRCPHAPQNRASSGSSVLQAGHSILVAQRCHASRVRGKTGTAAWRHRCSEHVPPRALCG